MNKQTQEALKMAIETMESVWDKADFIKLAKSINACKEALEQPAQEPNCYGDGNVYRGLRSEDSKVKTYHVNTHPHHWQGLTDDEIESILDNSVYCEVDAKPFARAIEQALKEKNT